MVVIHVDILSKLCIEAIKIVNILKSDIRTTVATKNIAALSKFWFSDN